MKKISGLSLGLLFLSGFISANASAAILTGSINAGVNGGLTATSPWGTQSPVAMLSWNVSRTAGLWTYHYILNLPAKDNSHAIFEVSDSFTSDNVFKGTTAGWELGSWGNEGNSNPGIPDLIYGLKFPGSGLADIFTIVTDRAPMWGSFYAKDGKYGGKDVYAYNTEFGKSSDASIYGNAPFGFAMVPDTHTTTVPEPGIMALFGIGMLSAAGMSMRRNKITV